MAATALTGLGMALLATFAATGIGPTGTSADWTDVARVRSDNPRIVALIARGNRESRTFQTITEGIIASDGIVYVQEGECPDGADACLLGVTAAGPRRILWVRVSLTSGRADEDVIASIAHELRHVQEVLDVRSIRSTAQMQLYYRRIGRRGSRRGYETAAAQRAGSAVHSEMRVSARSKACVQRIAPRSNCK